MSNPKIPQVMSNGQIDPSLIPYLPVPAPTSLDSVTDLNTVVTRGVYWQATNAYATAALHYPEVVAGLLEVFGNGSSSAPRVWQRYTPYQNQSHHSWVRSIDSTGSWSAWQQIGEQMPPTAIGASVDLNTYQTTGAFIQMSDAQAAGGTNFPIGYAGLLEVVGGASGWVYQRYTTYLHGGDGNRLYTRSLYSGSWAPWAEVVRADNALASAHTDARLDSFGALKHYASVVGYDTAGVNIVGNIVIDTPITFVNEMCSIHIQGYNYLSGFSDIDVNVNFYAYNNGTSQFINATVNSRGTCPVSARVAINGGTTASIILTSQAPNNYWQYPKIFVTDALVGSSTPPASWLSGWSVRMVTDANLASAGLSSITTCVTKGVGTITYAASGNYRAATVAGRKPLELMRDSNGYAHLRGVFENAVSISSWSKNIQFPVGSIPAAWLPATDIEVVGILAVAGYTAETFNFVLRGSNTSSDYSSGGGTGTLIWQALNSDSFTAASAGNIHWAVGDMVWMPGA